MTIKFCISKLYNLQVTQLTGFSDPVYAEAYVNVNQFDIVLDVLIVNQTNDTLQNLTLELATLGLSACLTNFMPVTCLLASLSAGPILDDRLKDRFLKP